MAGDELILRGQEVAEVFLGELVVAEGKHLSDDEILHMDYYVQGIEGTLPT